MRLLSLWQPWASLMAWQEKKIETRHWSSTYRGLVAIHAAKRCDAAISAAIYDSYPIMDALSRHGWAAARMYSAPTIRRAMTAILPFGAIVAVGRLVDCCPTSGPGAVFAKHPDLVTWNESEFGDYTPGRFAWVFEDMRELSEPLVWKGSQGLCGISEDLADMIRRHIPGIEVARV